MGKKKNKKIRLSGDGIVFSTDPDFQPARPEDDEPDTLPPQEQRLVITLDCKQRRGKEVTLVSGFVGRTADLADLGRTLKTYCGTGGSVKDGLILLQGDVRKKIFTRLQTMGYKCTLS